MLIYIWRQLLESLSCFKMFPLASTNAKGVWSQLNFPQVESTGLRRKSSREKHMWTKSQSGKLNVFSSRQKTETTKTLPFVVLSSSLLSSSSSSSSSSSLASSSLSKLKVGEKLVKEVCSVVADQEWIDIFGWNDQFRRNNRSRVTKSHLSSFFCLE